MIDSLDTMGLGILYGKKYWYAFCPEGQESKNTNEYFKNRQFEMKISRSFYAY